MISKQLENDTNPSGKKWAKDTNMQIPEEEIQMVDKKLSLCNND